MSTSLAFFGAFNPPTVAHIDLAEFAMQALGKDYVIFVPSKSTYISGFQGKDYAFSDGERLSMLNTIAAARPWMRVFDWEMKQEKQPRTYETLCRLRDEGESPSLLIGTDKLTELETKWLFAREIADEFGIVCMNRGNDDCEDIIRNSTFLQSLNLTCLAVPDAYHGISSTSAREYLRRIQEAKEALKAILPPELSVLSRSV